MENAKIDIDEKDLPTTSKKVVDKNSKRPGIMRYTIRKERGRRDKKNKYEKGQSASSVYSKLSSGVSVSSCCKYCGHRCCRQRRFEYELEQQYCDSCRSKIKKSLHQNRERHRKLNKASRLHMISEAIQIGSRSNMMSPLFVTCNSSPTDESPLPLKPHCEITTEIIYEALRSLSMWKNEVPTSSILEFVIQNYPVTKDREVLLDELQDQLKIAVITGIATQCSNDTWRLNYEDQKRRFPPNHVTTFWKVHADTLKPIHKKEDSEHQTETESNNQDDDAKDNPSTTNDQELI